MWTWHTKPLLSGKVCWTRPMTQELWGAVLSVISTISPGTRLRLTPGHLCRSCNWGKYSWTPLCRRGLTCTGPASIFSEHTSASWKTPGGNDGKIFRSSRRLGVNASRSWGSMDALTIGRPLTIASTSQRSVWRPSSSRFCVFKVELRTFPTDQISFSQDLHDASQSEG